MNISFELTHEDCVIAEVGYTFLETDNKENTLYLYDIEAENKIFVAGTKLNFITYIEGRHGRHIYCEYTLQLLRDVNILSSSCVVLFADIDFSEPDYYDYDQDVVDLLYLWDSNIDFTLLRKKQWIYNFACLLYWGVPDNIPNDKTIEIDCSTISTSYYFYTLLAETILGRKAYIGSNLDALDDSLKQTKVKKDNRNMICFNNYDTERDDRIWKSKTAIEILTEHNFQVEFSSPAT